MSTEQKSTTPRGVKLLHDPVRNKGTAFTAAERDALGLRGLYISLEDRGHVREILQNWPHRDARVIVVTDGERILGLGDLGTAGMGIPIGKLSLYTACAGIHPTHCLPVCLDVGTNNETFLDDPLYLGLERRRERGAAYDELVEEFISAAREVFPQALVQLEDFGNRNAFRLLQKYRDQLCLFDDDIQGTGAVALSGLLAALRISGGKLSEQRILFYGAGQAGIGIGTTIVAAMIKQGASSEQAHGSCYFFDSRGLLTSQRDEIPPQKLPFAHEHPPIDDFAEAIRVLQPTAIIGCAGQPGVFTQQIVESMSQLNKRPIVFALSNPTIKAECTAQQAYEWSEGRVIFASGSPFEPVHFGSNTYVPGQGNNAYIFPGVGLGAVVSHSRRVTDEMFLAASQILADQVGDEDLAMGRVYPALSRIREVSALIAAEVAAIAYRQGLAQCEEPDDILADVRDYMFEPIYPHYA